MWAPLGTELNVSGFTSSTLQMMYAIYTNKESFGMKLILPVSIWGHYFGSWCPTVLLSTYIHALGIYMHPGPEIKLGERAQSRP